ncbi:hypothetical protein BWR17_17725 [Phaeobacter inhibens]|nr:hypothetical protein BWR17_17725 [Phaeobacter inhibens]
MNLTLSQPKVFPWIHSFWCMYLCVTFCKVSARAIADCQEIVPLGVETGYQNAPQVFIFQPCAVFVDEYGEQKCHE